jgi:hypothetical protein
MRPFSVGEQVVVRYGAREGQPAEVVETQPAEVYKVRLTDGALLYYSEAGLGRPAADGPHPSPLAAGAGARRLRPSSAAPDQLT